MGKNASNSISNLFDLTHETSYQCLYLTGPKLSDLVSESEVPPTQAIGPSVWGGGAIQMTLC